LRFPAAGEIAEIAKANPEIELRRLCWYVVSGSGILMPAFHLTDEQVLEAVANSPQFCAEMVRDAPDADKPWLLEHCTQNLLALVRHERRRFYENPADGRTH
jgi:hypothetical protein